MISSIVAAIFGTILLLNLAGVFTPPKETGENLHDVNDSGNKLIEVCLKPENYGDEFCDNAMLKIRDPCARWPKLDRCTDSRIDKYLSDRGLV